MPNALVVVPILNSSATLFKGASWDLTPSLKVGRLQPVHYGLVAAGKAALKDEFAADAKSFHLTIDAGLSDAKFHAHLDEELTILRYVYDHFRDARNSPLLVGHCLEFVGQEKKLKLGRYFSDDTASSPARLRKSDFRLKDGTEKQVVNAFYGLVRTSITRNRRLLLTLERFNSALRRPKQADQIIDATVALEALVQDGKDELSFKFALYHSFASTSDPKQRNAAFTLLATLYSARSQVVHGSNDIKKTAANLQSLKANWPALEDLARNTINYHMFYLSDPKNDPLNWIQHLKALVITNAPRVNEGA